MTKKSDTFQLGLFDLRPPRVAASDTSTAAADSIVLAASRLRESVYNRIAQVGECGMTCDEVEAALAMRHQTASARIYELRHMSRLVDSGMRRTTRSGRLAVVWVAAMVI
jgi:hypothetical protein